VACQPDLPEWLVDAMPGCSTNSVVRRAVRPPPSPVAIRIAIVRGCARMVDDGHTSN